VCGSFLDSGSYGFFYYIYEVVWCLMIFFHVWFVKWEVDNHVLILML